MDAIDLVEVRKRLHDYKKLGKDQTISILKQIQTSDLTPTLLEQSKIYKTLGTLSKIDTIKEIDSEFSELNLIYIRDMSKSLVRQIKEILNTGDGRKNSTLSNNSNEKNNGTNVEKQVTLNPIKEVICRKEVQLETKLTYIQKEKIKEQPKNFPQHSDSLSELMENLNLPKDFQDLRRKVIVTLITEMMNEKTSSKSLIIQYPGSRYATLCRKLEDEAFCVKPDNYKNIIKQMIKHFKYDLDFSVRQRFLSNLIEPSQAVLLRTEDWMGEQVQNYAYTNKKLIESRQQASEAIKAGDIQHFKRIAQEINKDTILGKCSNCDAMKLKLVDEKQTRAADEPSTKFYECLSCGFAETTN